MLQRIVKRKGHTEYFDARKIYASVFSACMCLRMHDSEAELIADMVSHEVENMVKDKAEVSTQVLHKLVAETLIKYQPDAGYMYDTHREVH